MTDETVTKMNEKGFRKWEEREDFYKDDGPSGFTIHVQKCLDADIWCVSAQGNYKFVDVGIGFTSPFAAATYAERHVIPALLAGKESA